MVGRVTSDSSASQPPHRAQSELAQSADRPRRPAVGRPPPRAFDTVLVCVTGATGIIVTLIAAGLLLARDEGISSAWWALVAVSGTLALIALGLGLILLVRRRTFLASARLLLIEFDEALEDGEGTEWLQREAMAWRDALLISGDLELAEQLTEARRRARRSSAAMASDSPATTDDSGERW
jgi:hypothetical protein